MRGVKMISDELRKMTNLDVNSAIKVTMGQIEQGIKDGFEEVDDRLVQIDQGINQIEQLDDRFDLMQEEMNEQFRQLSEQVREGQARTDLRLQALYDFSPRLFFI